MRETNARPTRPWPRCSPPTSSATRRPRAARCCSRCSSSRRRCRSGYGLEVPERPEVETVRRQLAPVLEGRRLARVEILDGRLMRPFDPLEVAAELEGERVARVERRGKYLIVRFASGRALLVHLRMTGSFHVDEEASHERAVIELDDKRRVSYRDVRRVGTWLLLEPGEVEPYLDEKVGEEPLDALFTVARLGERLEQRR